MLTLSAFFRGVFSFFIHLAKKSCHFFGKKVAKFDFAERNVVSESRIALGLLKTDKAMSVGVYQDILFFLLNMNIAPLRHWTI